MRHFLSRSTLFLFLIACLFIVPACDSGGSNGDGGSGDSGGSSTVGVDDPTASNSFKMNVSSTSSSTQSKASKASKTYGGYAFQFAGTNPNTGEDFYVLFFTSADPNNFDQTSAEAELFGALVSDQFSDPPPSGRYAVGKANDSNADFYGLIGEDFNTGENGTRTIQALSSGEIVIDNSGDLAVTDFVNVSGQQVTLDLPVEDQGDITTEDNVSIELENSIEPGETNNYAETGFGFSVSTN